ncbi:MAG: hypothetical protein HY547_00630 [Elusimicrobia bacterium]|nr:hypothetical protein [Elusimicrobiota bacterium]
MSCAGLGCGAWAAEAQTPEIAQVNKPQVAVVEFEGQGISPMEAVAITNFFRSALVNTNTFRVIDRSNVDKILTEQKFQQTGCTSAECAVQIGKILNVERMLTGAVNFFKGLYFLNVKITNVETGEVTASYDGQSDNALNMRDVAENMAGSIALAQGAPSSAKARTETVEMKTFLADKKIAQVASVEGGQVLINRGSLQGVRTKDMYTIYGADGKAKGELEAQIISETSSFGKMKTYAKKGGLPIASGDTAKFLIHRNVFGLGGMGGVSTSQSFKNSTDTERDPYLNQSAAGGYLFSFYFWKGWSLDWLGGALNTVTYRSRTQYLRTDFLIPLWIKKSFLYPQKIMPFFMAGLAGRHSNLFLPKEVFNHYELTPMIGIGAEFFPGHRLGMRLDLQYYPAPEIEYQEQRYKTPGLFSLLGFYINW